MIAALQASVRPVVTYALVGAVLAGFFLGRVDGAQIMVLATAAFAFWFGERSALKVPAQPVPVCPYAAPVAGRSPQNAAAKGWRG